MKYESLENEMHCKGIEIINMKFKGGLKGLYADNTIAIDTKIDTSAERCCILAEEAGHYYTSSGDIISTQAIQNAKQEKRARNWGFEKLAGIPDIINAFNNGAKNKYEMAEFLNVTEKFLENAVNHYKEKYGMYYATDKYIVYFEPLGILKIF